MKRSFRRQRREHVETLYPPTSEQHQYNSEDATPTEHDKPAKRTHKHQNWRDAFSVLLVIISALVLALILIAFVFQSYQVDGISMQNTLHNNDRLIVWKVPRTWARITGHSYIPDRGDIIVFNEPGLGVGHGPKQLIKRVVGLPGDHLVIKNDKVTIYNKQHPNGFSMSTNFDGVNGNKVTSGDINVTLKKNQIFVMGDNRPDSLDSRIFGPVDVNNIIGKLVVRVLPIDNFKIF